MRSRMHALLIAPLLALGCYAQAGQAPAEQAVPMPNKDGSLKFAVFGDFGTGEPVQYQMAAQIARTHQSFKFPLVILVGDNLYGSERPQDFRQKFELPYKPLLDAGVKFQASLGNHDSREQREYPPFNMDGKLYYSFKAPSQSARFFALESTYMEPQQIVWFEKELRASTDDWKIVYFHHSLYCSAGRHGSDVQLREKLEPLIVNYNVTVVFTGHDHVYERVKPQKGVTYFVVGSTGKVAPGDLSRGSPIMARGFDSEQAFLIAEIDGDQMTFNAISRSGKLVDSGTVTRRKAK
jgi:predicted MPP superfamily phosphohydrolase